MYLTLSQILACLLIVLQEATLSVLLKVQAIALATVRTLD